MKKKNELILLQKRLAILLSSGLLLTSLAGCQESELAPDTSNLDLLKTSDEENGKSLSKGVTQVKDVNGEDFKLVLHYISGDEKWSINANKKLFFEIKTQGLPDNLSVYIDNIHIDTSIVSTKAVFDGILQDTMDDRIHNSLMLGFPINDNNSYFGINEIDGQNETFIKGYSYGNTYYHGGSISQKRYLESDYLEKGVWANKIDTVIDLLIVDKKTNEVLRQVSVGSSLLVEVNDKITFEKGNNLLTYDYDRDGSRTLYKKEKIH